MVDINQYEMQMPETGVAVEASFLKKLCDLGISQPLNHTAIRLGLLHLSARTNVCPSEHDKNGVNGELLGALQSFGKAVITLFCIDSCCDSKKYSSRGEVSFAAATFSALIVPAVAKAIGLSNAVIFGKGVTASEKNSGEVVNGMLFQFIGAISHAHGLSASRAILRHFLNLRPEGETVLQKDYKTLLQEYLQSRKKAPPKYQVLESLGPAHACVFRIRVATQDGRSAEGEGSTIKGAGQNAAKIYLQQHYSSVIAGKSRPLTVAKHTPNFDRTYPVKDPTFLRQLAQDCFLHSKDENDLALALIHRSYNLHFTYDAGLGLDFGYLAILGSAVQNWATQDLIIHRYLDRLAEENRPPLASVLAQVLRDVSITELFDVLNLDRGLLVGSGQRTDINLKIRTDVVSALIAIMFRHKAPVCEFGEDVFRTKSGRLGAWIAERIRNAIQQDRDALHSPKTLLQERCQAIGLRVVYDSDIQNIAMYQLKVAPGLHILRGDRELIHGQLPPMVKQSRREGEELLARTILDIFDHACGIQSRKKTRFEKGQQVFAQFFLEQALTFASANAMGPIQIDRARSLAKAGMLGTKYLEAGNQEYLEKWIAVSQSLLGRSLVTNSLMEFYRLAGRIVGAGKGCSDLDVIKTLKDIAVKTVTELDPLTYQGDVRKSYLFERITDLAVAFKLKATSNKSLSLSQMLDDVFLIFNGRYRCLNIHAPNSDLVTISTIPGALPALLTLVSKTIAGLCVLSTSIDVSITLTGRQVQLWIHWDDVSSKSSALREIFDASTTYQFLKNNMPFQELNISDREVEFLLFGEDDWQQLSDARKLEIMFHNPRPEAPELYELLASWLHDIKNDLIAFQAAVHNARKASSGSERYRHMQMASTHIEATQGYLNSIALVVGAESSVQLSTIDLKDFFRQIVSDILSWAPSSVAVMPPSNTDQESFVSDPRILRTVLINLCKNAVEAIKATGRLTLEWVFDPQNNILEIELTDSAGALSEEACAQLNNGFTILSQKPTGSGVGLITVLLMLKQLGGRAIFSSEPGRRTSVRIECPSSFTEELAAESTPESPIISVEVARA